jgi:hypothetical protein
MWCVNRPRDHRRRHMRVRRTLSAGSTFIPASVHTLVYPAEVQDTAPLRSAASFPYATTSLLLSSEVS